MITLAAALVACSGDDEATNGDENGNGEEAGSAPAEPIGTLTFDGETYELTRSDCDVGGEGLSRWFAFDADGDVELAVYEGDAGSVALLVRDDHPDGPAWEQTEDPSLIEIDGDDAAIAGSATVSPAVIGEEVPAGDPETVEFEFSC